MSLFKIIQCVKKVSVHVLHKNAGWLKRGGYKKNKKVHLRVLLGSFRSRVPFQTFFPREARRFLLTKMYTYATTSIRFTQEVMSR